jgi:8-oxo-dGTP diphosphatase
MPSKNKEVLSGIPVAVDAVIFSVIDGALRVLLIQIKGGRYDGKWAVPGGLVSPTESLDEAADRVLSEKAGVDGVYLEQLYTFGDTSRDVRGRSVSVAYFALVDGEDFFPKTNEYYADIAWKRVDRLPEMAFDHRAIVSYAHERLIAKLGYSNIGYALLPREFTLSELQSVYESILGKTLDKRNFRKKIQEIGLVKETGNVRRLGATRPARLYSFSERKPRIVDVL